MNHYYACIYHDQTRTNPQTGRPYKFFIIYDGEGNEVLQSASYPTQAEAEKRADAVVAELKRQGA